jgi:hypothetical protein
MGMPEPAMHAAMTRVAAVERDPETTPPPQDAAVELAERPDAVPRSPATGLWRVGHPLVGFAPEARFASAGEKYAEGLVMPPA